MDKLALAAGRGSELAGARAKLAVDARAADEAYQRLGESVLVYLHVNGVVLEFVGLGRVAGVGLGPASGRLVTLDPYSAFAAPVSGEAERDAPGARRLLEVAEPRFDAIMAQARQAQHTGVAEAAAGFSSSPSAATYSAIRDQVLRAWRYRCAFTGEGDTAARPLSIVAIQPRDRGGPLHVGNYLPMVPELERAWRSGHFAVGEDFRVLGDLYRLAPEEQDRMLALFRMLLPDDPNDYPDPALLAWHRSVVFGRS